MKKNGGSRPNRGGGKYNKGKAGGHGSSGPHLVPNFIKGGLIRISYREFIRVANPDLFG